MVLFFLIIFLSSPNFPFIFKKTIEIIFICFLQTILHSTLIFKNCFQIVTNENVINLKMQFLTFKNKILFLNHNKNTLNYKSHKRQC